MMTVVTIVAIAALISAIVAGARPDHVPLWVAVVLTAIAVCLLVLPK
jgi:hypothetical protein